MEQANFGPAVLNAANERGMGLLALKAIARTKVTEWKDRPYDKCWYAPEDRPDVAHLMLRYTLNLPGVAAAVPPGDPGMFKMCLGFADELDPLTDAELVAVYNEELWSSSPFSILTDLIDDDYRNELAGLKKDLKRKKLRLKLKQKEKL